MSIELSFVKNLIVYINLCRSIAFKNCKEISISNFGSSAVDDIMFLESKASSILGTLI